MQIGSVGANTPTQVDADDTKSVAVASKALSQQKQDGANALALIQSAAPTGLQTGKLVSVQA